MKQTVLMMILAGAVLNSCGGGPAATWDRVVGKKKKDHPFVADIKNLKGAYRLTSLKQWHKSGSTGSTVSWDPEHRDSDPNIMLYFNDGTIEIASRTESPLKTCAVAQPISQGPSNRLDISATGGCDALSLEIVEQSTTELVVKVQPFNCPFMAPEMCTGLIFGSIRDSDASEKLYSWHPDVTPRLPPKIKSLQYQDVAVSQLETLRGGFKSAITGATVNLNRDLKLTWDIAKYYSFIINGNVISMDDKLEDIIAQTEKFDTTCEVTSSKTKSVSKFQRKIAITQVQHVNRNEGKWTYKQLHEGLDSILTREQQRAPIESKSPTLDAQNFMEFSIEAADSEKDGNSIKIDSDLLITCDKRISAGPIAIEDVKKALGDVITFTK